MKIINCTEIKICENNFYKMSFFLEENITSSDVVNLSRGKVLISNEKLSLPYFKIIDTEHTIRGSLESNQLSFDFNTRDRIVCAEVRNQYCKDCISEFQCNKKNQ